MAIHGDRQLNWLQRLLKSDSLQQSYQEFQAGPVLPTLDVIGAGPYDILISNKADYATSQVASWRNDAGETVGPVFGGVGDLGDNGFASLLSRGFWYRFFYIRLGVNAGATIWRIDVQMPNWSGTGPSTQLRPLVVGDNTASIETWNSSGATPAVGNVGNLNLQQFSKLWLPGPITLNMVLQSGVGTGALLAFAARMPAGASSFP